MKITDIYLYDDVPVLKNLLNIKDEKMLEKAESDITYIKLLDIDNKINDEEFNFDRLLKIHKYIFGDIYEWAGKVREVPLRKGERVLGGDTVRYSVPGCIEKDAEATISELNAVEWNKLNIEDTAITFSKLIAKLWQVHPFREGNTRTVITFATQFAYIHGFKINKVMLRENADYVRDALVKASDGPYSEYEYLIKIIKDSIIKS